MHFQNTINAIVIFATMAIARPQTPGQARQSLNLESRQALQPEPCSDFFNQPCSASIDSSSLCCPQSSLCFPDTDQLTG